MSTWFFGIYSYSIGLNLFRNFRLFRLLNGSKDSKDYFTLKKDNLANPHVELLSCIYIICYISLTCSFFYLNSLNLFLKFFIYTYALYVSYRVSISLMEIFQFKTANAQELKEEQEQEIGYIEEMVDVKPFLALEPITFFILEVIFFALSCLWMYSKTLSNW